LLTDQDRISGQGSPPAKLGSRNLQVHQRHPDFAFDESRRRNEVSKDESRPQPDAHRDGTAAHPRTRHSVSRSLHF